MSEIARPKPGESEEDLLRQQREFLRGKISPSVKIINKRSEKRVSKFANKHKLLKKDSNSAISSSVLGDIKEKIPDYSNWSMSLGEFKKGFPEPFSSDTTYQDEKASVFVEQLTQQKLAPIDDPMESSELEERSNIAGNRSYILCGPDSTSIHQENLKLLSKMSPEQILAEQENLKRSLDPNLLKFILSKRKSTKRHSNDCSMEVDKCESDDKDTIPPPDTNMRQINVPEDVMSLKQENKWLHMDVLEGDKLSWIGDIPSVKFVDPDQPYNARFDFQGLLMPYVSEKIDVREGLYNHGDEPERPGYSLEELFQLSRSSVQQQRIIALNVISNILENAKKGYYDECFNSELVSLLLDHDLFLLLRFCLDDNTEAVLVPALSAMKNLLCSEVDELCLDRGLGCSGSLQQQPFLEVEDDSSTKGDKPNELELKDYQILRLDIVKGALRTDIVTRIRYILEVLQPCPNAVLSCLHILIRLARHSFHSICTISQCPRLIRIIIDKFIPKSWTPIVDGRKLSEMHSVYNVPLVQALKLLRLLLPYGDIRSDLMHKYHVMTSIMSYISIDPRECSLPFQEALRLTLDSFYFWQTFLAYNLGTESFIDMHPILMRLLQYHFSCTSTDDGSVFSHEHGTALISLIEQAVHVAHYHNTSQTLFETKLVDYHVKEFCSVLQLCLTKWFSQLSTATTLTFSAMKLVGAALNCLLTFYKYNFVSEVLTWRNDLEKFLESSLMVFLRSPGFQKATINLKTCSCLLFNGFLGTKRDPPPLPSVGSLMWKGTSLTPVLKEISPIPLIHGISNFLIAVYSAHKDLNSKYLELFITDKYIIQYIETVCKKDISHMANHWFCRMEVNMLASLTQLINLKGLYNDMFHYLAFRLVGVIQEDNKYVLLGLMKNIIFNPDFFVETSFCKEMAALQLGDQNVNKIPGSKERGGVLEKLPQIFNFYQNYLELKKTPPYHHMMEVASDTKKSKQKFPLPKDWPYFPILSLHKEGKASKQADKELVDQVTKTLEWVILLEEMRPSVLSIVPVGERFCHISKVFLSASDAFLDPYVHSLLSNVLRYLMKYYKEMRLQSSFYDLYGQLLEQFAAVSYGDSLFGQFLLVPLQQRQSNSLRKQVWSEHAAVLRILSTPLSELMFPFNELLEPCETDHSLLQNYLECLALGMVQENWCPVLYKVALYHVSTFIKLHHGTTFAEQLRSKINKLGNKNLQLVLLETCL